MRGRGTVGVVGVHVHWRVVATRCSLSTRGISAGGGGAMAQVVYSAYVVLVY